ncbi:MAG: hypothetical protein ABFS08_02680 [Pseudomonadota bacterium]
MTTFILHFACTSPRASVATITWTADACVISPTIEEAEASARELIAERSYHATELIAFAKISEQQVASLSQLEATLYLKAQQNSTRRAVVFSEWHD